MAVKIDRVLEDSSAFEAGIQSGQSILSINGEAVRDLLDLQFYASEERLHFVLESPDGSQKECILRRSSNKALGIEPVEHQCQNCHNHCIFCFIDQMPPYQRHSLYEKDDDYVYSFIFGNYITLTNLAEEDLERIVEQRLSPLYISVHSTNPAIRQSIMRYKKPNFDLYKLLSRFASEEIGMHFQIVVLPGYNDGEHLERSLRDLLDLGHATLSIGVVPVGLTGHRERLTPLRAFGRVEAVECLSIIDRLRQQQGGERIYAADEIFVLADKAIPKASYYGDFAQLENGIGMLRLLLDRFRYKKQSFMKELGRHPYRYLMLCSEAAYGTICHLANKINDKLDKPLVRVQAIQNKFFGGQVTVGGLLCYQDIVHQAVMHDDEIPIICDCIFNYERLSLDGKSPEAFLDYWKRPLLLVSQFFEDWEYLNYT